MDSGAETGMQLQEEDAVLAVGLQRCIRCILVDKTSRGAALEGIEGGAARTALQVSCSPAPAAHATRKGVEPMPESAAWQVVHQ